MSGLALPVIDAPQPATHTIDVAALQAAMRTACSGEVRFDRLSRALYSTDASVYQIVPLGVVLPRSEADIVAVVQTCAPLRRAADRARRRHLAGGPVRSAPASSSIARSTLNRILEINAGERWARVQPGCVLDDLNRQAAAASACSSPPDISTANRATIGGMIANNSSGTHSIIHGKTIDHVLELRVVLADGSIDRCAAAGRRRVGREVCCRTIWKDAAIAPCGSLASEHADEIERRYPKILRRVGGYNLDLFARRQRQRGQSRPSVRRLGGHARRRARSEAAAGRTAAGQGAAGRAVRRSARRAGRHAGHPDARAGRGRGDGPVHPR